MIGGDLGHPQEQLRRVFVAWELGEVNGLPAELVDDLLVVVRRIDHSYRLAFLPSLFGQSNLVAHLLFGQRLLAC